MVDPYIDYSEESGDVSIGEAFVARIIGAVLGSPNWSSTAMILVYDEHGGWYDHVPPRPAVRPDDVPPEITVPPDQPGAYDYTGFRVPCVVISPYAKQNFVSHTVFDHTSILKFVETKWNLPAMTYRDANAHNMLDFLDVHATVPPFAEPPKVRAPLNPFIGPLPATSGSPGFHPIAMRRPGVDASACPLPVEVAAEARLSICPVTIAFRERAARRSDPGGADPATGMLSPRKTLHFFASSFRPGTTCDAARCGAPEFIDSRVTTLL